MSKNVLWVSQDTRQRVNIAKALAGAKTQDDVINDALDALKVLGDYMGFSPDTSDEDAIAAYRTNHPEAGALEIIRTGGAVLAREKGGDDER